MLFIFFKKIHNVFFIILFILGYCWGIGQCFWRVHEALPSSLENKIITVQGRVASVPNCYSDVCQFLFNITLAPEHWHKKVILSWYKIKTSKIVEKMIPGQLWQLNIKLKKPRGFDNPGNFAYEAWVFEQGIFAKGYVVGHAAVVLHSSRSPFALLSERTSLSSTLPESQVATPLKAQMVTANCIEKSGWHDEIDQVRQSLAEPWEKEFSNSLPLLGVLLALTIGLTSGISTEQWQVFMNTGTIHLISISGFHISFIASIGYSLMNFIWRRIPFLCMRWPAQRAAAAFALFLGVIYSLLAGMSLPTERSLIMLSVFMGSLLFQRQTDVWQCFRWSILAVVLWDPFAPLNMSFWLSYSSVGIILYVILVPRLLLPVENKFKKIVKMSLYWLLLQGQIFIGLIPFSLFWFYQVSMSSLWANLIAIPVTGFFVLPFALMALLMQNISWNLARYCMLIANYFFEKLYEYLVWITHHYAGIIIWPLNHVWLLFFGVLAVLLLLAPKGFMGRYLGLVFCLPIIFLSYHQLNWGEATLNLLDVGQGLASLIQTKNHTLIFDTGPKFSETLDAGNRVILPYLKSQNIRQLDAVVVSHADMDHRGGLASLLANIPVKKVFVNDQHILKTAELCRSNIHWEWDGVQFQFLMKGLDVFSDTNNTSCVLKVSNKKHAFIIAGDLEKPAEIVLAREYGDQLKADLITANHHGSKTSSSLEWIEATDPRFVLFSAGYLNRFHFPSQVVVERYKNFHVKTFSTVDCGMIRWELTADLNNNSNEPFCYRKGYLHSWL